MYFCKLFIMLKTFLCKKINLVVKLIEALVVLVKALVVILKFCHYVVHIASLYQVAQTRVNKKTPVSGEYEVFARPCSPNA